MFAAPPVAPAPRAVEIPQIKLAEGYEVVVFAPHRPIRARVAIRYEGKVLAERWADVLRSTFKAFDRNGDGSLDEKETQYIFSDASLAQLLQTAYYYPNPANAATLAKLDTNGDGMVSFAEFAAYYKTAAAKLVQSFPPQDEAPFNAQTTEALFKLMDANGDGKLTRAEVDGVQNLLATKDADEDECLSPQELLGANLGYNPRQFQPQPGRGGAPAGPRVPQNVVVFDLDKVPGTITQRVIQEFDKNKDFELTKAECGFDDATFARLDLDKNGSLTGEELDAWRTGEPDVDATLSLSSKAADCKVILHTDPKAFAARGFTMKTIDPGRVVIRNGRQPIELWAFAANLQNGRGYQLKQTYQYLFTQLAGTKGYVSDKDFTGNNAVQYQQVRVLLEPADFDSDGKLTKEEFDKYFDLQQPFVDMSVGLLPAVQTPTLFQLLDENKDNRLGVRELRTAWTRLRSLEPSGGEDVVTRAAIQPAVSLRLSRTLDRSYMTQQVYYQNPNPMAPAQPKGPVWFRKMDRNGDGDLSRIEFLGTKAEFDAMDADKDGLISLEEAEAFDKAMKK
ncbi:MAG: EF-hand domain-containing protein [Gemmataceae bacterium]